VAFVLVRVAVPSLRGYFSSPADNAARSALRETSSSDRAEMNAYFDAHGIHTQADAKRAGATLAAAGMVRLSDTDLRFRAGTLQRVMDRLPISECARVAREGASWLGPERLLEILNSPNEMDQFIKLALRSMLAEMRGNPPVIELSEAESNDAINALMATVPQAEQARYDRAMADLKSSSDADACWAGRITFAAVDSIAEPNASHLARLLAMPG
jgi:hypothetical protein